MIHLSAPSMVSQHFAFATGRLGVLEQLLLRQSDIDRILGAPTGEEAVRILHDLAFVAHKDEKEFVVMLQETERSVRAEVEGMCPADRTSIFDVLWIEGDRALISFLLKKHHGLTSDIATSCHPAVSVYSEEEWQAVIDEKVDENDDRRVALQCLIDATDYTPATIDQNVAAICARHALKVARTSGSSLIQRYVQHTIDAINLRTYIRLSEPSAHHFIVGGILSADLLSESNDAIAQSMKAARFPSLLVREFEREESVDALQLEQGIAALLRDDLAAMRQEVLGPEALFGYAARALSHVHVLRVLLMGKTNNLPLQDIKSLLPPLI